ncbi:MAG TPA: cupredoxin family copper-binding protein [Chloroflexota bacterium]|nr:cupredoxin family copper-binding protein [Chloroflexota bacterium]
MPRLSGAIVGVLMIGAIATSLLGYRSTQAAAPAATAHATVQVTIQNFAFSPQMITITPGTTVTWTQKDSAPHTVTSDTGAWTASAPLSTGQTFSHTFTKMGTYPYHCSVHPNMIASVIVATHPSAGSGPGMGMPGNMGAMGKASKLMLTSWTGYYDGKTLTYISTDTSSKAEALRDHINYSASLAKSLPQASKIYFVTNGSFATRGAVFGSTLGAGDYTPLWQEIQVTWKTAGAAVLLTSDNQINALAAKGMLRLKSTGVVLNCPIIAKSSMAM